ncbi:pre-mRNA-splicing factor 38B-like [Zophobas morio]|uniref:pre-mRNA-splicing factor 38B-like n=1 Tax=Zophobas morio TaxID=2755281 RepID=UPI0030834DAA
MEGKKGTGGERRRERKTDVTKNIREERQRGKTKRAESRLVRKTGGKKSKEKKDRCRHNGNGERQRRKDTSEAEEDRKERQKETKKITKNVKDRRRSKVEKDRGESDTGRNTIKKNDGEKYRDEERNGERRKKNTQGRTPRRRKTQREKDLMEMTVGKKVMGKERKEDSQRAPLQSIKKKNQGDIEVEELKKMISELATQIRDDMRENSSSGTKGNKGMCTFEDVAEYSDIAQAIRFNSVNTLGVNKMAVNHSRQRGNYKPLRAFLGKRKALMG